MTRPYPEPFTTPDPQAVADSRIMDFARHAGVDGTDYATLHHWSVTDLEGFWGAVWDYFDIDGVSPYEQVLAEERMPGARWFPGATLNYTHHARRNLTDDTVAIIALAETGSSHEVTGNRLRAQVASVAATLRDLGVSKGDRVVRYLPNTPHAIVAFLATASLGAVWSVCGQDYAPKAAADRFAQLEPTVLISADGYLFNGTTPDRRDATLELAGELPTLKAALLVDHVGLPWPTHTYPSLVVPWEEASTRTEELTCAPVPFDHPLWIVFSSGTTGLPKGVVHGHGGVLLEHLKTLGLHSDLGPGDRASAYPWVRHHVGDHVLLASTSGGTDVVSGFAGSAPSTPVWAGELSAPHLGVALAAYDAEGLPIVDQVGELVVTRPMPSMPLYFWNDPDGTRYRDAYFSSHPGVWRHGDWITLTGHGSVIVHGRSDSTLNRNGVRLGSADIHDVVERLPEITEALVIGAEEPDGGYWMPLFVVLAAGVTLDDPLREKIKDAIRTGASPRHAPDEILEVPGIPHTRTGKKLEVPVKRLLQGAPVEQVVNPAAVDAPDLIDYFARLGAERRGRST
ncbi:AMP-binding protein [Streptomyces sp. R44]|uniref:AMP-binding protein n=1 Tax=Streptomyces sp. R44 TaxID=3238633 RepID=A0AB39TET7_9ACTN